MRYHKLPKQLKVKVRNYFYHRYHGRLFNEKTMLKELSHVLEEVSSWWNLSNQECLSLIQRSPYFGGQKYTKLPEGTGIHP